MYYENLNTERELTMSDIKLLLTSKFMPHPFTGEGNYVVRLSGETPAGPLNIFEWDEDESMAVRKVMALVQRIANRRGRGRKPKYYQACCYVRDVFITPARISSLNPTTPKEEVRPTGRVIVSAVSNLLH
jgi:hypothetical protein